MKYKKCSFLAVGGLKYNPLGIYSQMKQKQYHDMIIVF